MSSMGARLVEAINNSGKGAEMTGIIERIQEADRVIKGEQPQKCVWCGADLKVWAEELGDEHAKDAVCNHKEAECLALIIDLAENYDRGDGPTDTPGPRKILNEIVRIAKSKP